MDDSESPTDSNGSSSSSSSIHSSSSDLKEEIGKVIRIQSARGDLRERSICQLSGGERKRVALALALGFTELAATRGRLTSNLLVLDEVSFKGWLGCGLVWA